MKSQLVTSLAALALVLTGCGSSDGASVTPSTSSSASPTASATMPAETTLAQWVSKAGVTTVIKTFSASLTALSDDIGAADATDPKSLSDAIAKHGPALLQVSKDLAAMPSSDDTAYEALRTAAAFSIRSFAKLAIGLASTPDAQRMTAVTAAIAAMTPMNSALKPFADYIANHGKDTVHPAS